MKLVARCNLCLFGLWLILRYNHTLTAITHQDCSHANSVSSESAYERARHFLAAILAAATVSAEIRSFARKCRRDGPERLAAPGAGGATLSQGRESAKALRDEVRRQRTPSGPGADERDSGSAAGLHGETFRQRPPQPSAGTHRAQILVTDAEGHQPLRAFATGIRNGVGMAVNPVTGDLWVSANERDGLGDGLVPDYVTRVKEGGYYGWPWFYLGNHEDPRLAGDRPDLAGKAVVPDVLEASHSASLQMTFYTATSGPAAFPAEYRGDAFVALHGSWNRGIRTGYKIIRVLLKSGVPNGQYDDFLTGFVADNRRVWGRPVGVTVAHDGALLITEDGNGTMWRVAYEKDKFAKTEPPLRASPGTVVTQR